MAASFRARPKHSSIWRVVRTYLVERESLFARIRESQELPTLLVNMTALSALFAGLYGLTVGLYAGGWQILFDAIKFPLLLLATLALCVLALYMLNSLAGARLSLLQTTSVVVSAILVTAALLLALTPPLGFIMLTSLRDYHLVVFMNLIALCLAGAGGISFAFQATASVHQDPGHPTPLPQRHESMDGPVRSRRAPDALALPPLLPADRRLHSALGRRWYCL